MPAGRLNINAGGSLFAEIATAGADKIVVNGPVNIAATATLNLSFLAGPAPAVGTPLVLIENDGTDLINGTFAGIAEGQTLNIGGRSVTVSYIGGTGNDLTITLNPNAPGITFNPAANPTGSEDNPALPTAQSRIPLGIVVNNVDTGATTTVVISGIPQSTSPTAANGARLVNSAGVPYAQSPAGTVTLTNVANGTLDVFLEKDDNRPLSPFDLSIVATSSVGALSATTNPAVTRTVVVNNSAPVASISGPSIAGRGQPTVFTFNGIDAPGDLVTGLRYEIDWGDGQTTTLSNVTTSSSQDIEHSFSALGNVQVTLRVIDDEGAFDLETLNVTVSAVFVDDDGNLIIGGTNGSDRIVLSTVGGGVRAMINGVAHPALQPDGGVIRVFGGDGSDTISISSNVLFGVEIYGGAGNDYLTGGTRADVLDGGDDNDRILGGGGADVLYGGNGHDSLGGGAGNDMLFGDDYFDTDLVTILEGVGNDLLNGDAGDDEARGGAGNDKVNGGAGHDQLFGGDGNDSLQGNVGNDFLHGEADGDLLNGNEGNDVLIGGTFADRLYGGNGGDLLLGDDMAEDIALLLYGDWLAQGIGGVATLRDEYASSVDEDDSPDGMYGQNSSDWFLVFFGDKVFDAKSGDVVDKLP